jgi:tRNA(adenine34) deaminase
MMCTGAIIQARIPRVVYGATNHAFGHLSKTTTKIKITSGVLAENCSAILSEFFQLKRS